MKTVGSDHGVKTSKTVLLEAVKRRFADIDTEMLIVIKRNVPFMIVTQRILSSVVVGLASFGFKHFVANCLILINILKRLRFPSSLGLNVTN